MHFNNRLASLMAKNCPFRSSVGFSRRRCGPLSWARKYCFREMNKSLSQWENLRSGSKVTQAQFLLFGMFVVSYGTNEFKPVEFGLTKKVKRRSGFLRHPKGNGTCCNKTGMIDSDRGFEPEDVVETRLLPKKICSKQ